MSAVDAVLSVVVIIGFFLCVGLVIGVIFLNIYFIHYCCCKKKVNFKVLILFED